MSRLDSPFQTVIDKWCELQDLGRLVHNLNKELKLLTHSGFCTTNCWMCIQDLTYFTLRESNALKDLIPCLQRIQGSIKYIRVQSKKGLLAPFLPGPCFQRIPPSALGSQCWQWKLLGNGLLFPQFSLPSHPILHEIHLPGDVFSYTMAKDARLFSYYYFPSSHQHLQKLELWHKNDLLLVP